MAKAPTQTQVQTQVQAKPKPQTAKTAQAVASPAKSVGLPVVVVTSCSSTRTVVPTLRGRDIGRDMTMSQACDEWVRRLKEHGPTMTPGELYRGIGFHTVSRIWRYLERQEKGVYIVSAGQGLMRLDQKIVPYDFTSDPKHRDSIWKVITQEPFVFPVWWKLINTGLYGGEGRPVSELLDDPEVKIVVVAAGKRLVKLLVDDVVSGRDVNAVESKLRFINTSVGSSSIPGNLKGLIVQYDQRLKSGTFGNRNDADQRAALHFIKLLESRPELVEEGIEEQQRAVEESLGGGGGGGPVILVRPNKIGEERLDRIVEAISGAGGAGGADGNPDIAYKALRRRMGSGIGSLRNFRKAWVRGQDRSAIVSGQTIEVSEEESKAASSAVLGIMDKLAKRTGKVVTWEDEQAALEGLRVMVSALREVEGSEDFRLSVKEIIEWAGEYYSALGREVPKILGSGSGSATRLAFFMTSYAETLGLKVISIPGQGGNFFALA